MIKILLFLLAGLILANQADAQVYSQLYSGKQEMFLEAESYHLFEEYNEALPLYLELLKDQTDNSFLNYRTGTCYLNIPGKKEMAIEYLEKAIKDMDERDRRPTFRTTKAPLDALFFLGNAYHINYQFEKALEMYYQFKEMLNPSIYNSEVVKENIKASKNAMESIKHPVFLLEENLGERINTRFSETNPAVSGNQKVLVFTRVLPFYDGVFFSEMSDEDEWSWPIEITPQIGSDGDCYPVSLSYDGKELYLYKSDDLVGNIYISRFVDGQWTRIKKLNENINTGYWESHASISKDGNTLYFTSNRPGGYGGLDIYYSKKNEKGDWGKAVNMGPVINTPYNEDTPFITEDGTTLYFSSYGHHNIGGYDVFYSTLLKDDEWSTPLNAGYGINTPDDDLFFNPVKNGIYAYFSKFDDEGFGGMDIYMYEIFSDTHPRKFRLKGIMRRQDGLQTGEKAWIRVVDPLTGDTIYSAKPHQITGEYEIMLEAGDWEVIFSEEGHKDKAKPLKLPLDREDPSITIDARMERTEPDMPDITEVITDRIILPEETMPPKTLGIEQHHYEVTDDDRISIPMRLERNTLLEIEKYLDGELIDTEEIKVRRRRFDYDYIPKPGENILRFIYTDREGDVIIEEVVISVLPSPVEDPPVEDPPVEVTAADKLDEMIKKYDRVYRTPDEFIRELMPHVSEELAEFLSGLVEKGKVPETIEELIKLIIDSSEEHGYEKWEILDTFEKLAPTDAPAPEEEPEIAPDERKFPFCWILFLAILLLIAFYYKGRVVNSGKK